MKNTVTTVASVVFLGLILSGLVEAQTSPAARAVFEKMKNGIDVGHEQTFPNNAKGDNNKEYLNMLKAAGFKSIRFFHNSALSADGHAGLVREALDEGLVVAFCQFAPKGTTKERFVSKWKELAQYYKDVSNNLLFEMLNEPGNWPGIKDRAVVMDWINSAIIEIRTISPHRILVIGGPDWNGPEMLRYVDASYLGYNVNGITFVNDQNVFAAIHLYAPGGYTMPKGKSNTLKDFPTWKTQITSGLDRAVDWSAKWNRPVVMTEWGAQWNLKQPADFLEYTQFFVDECRKRNIAWTYYCGSPHIIKPGVPDFFYWTILRFETRSWYPGIVPILTGANATKP
jgi:hypothetical protein